MKLEFAVLMSVRQSAEIGMAVALAVVLGLLTRLVQLPYGGSVNLSGLPIIVIALRQGVVPGVTTGALYGIVAFVLNPYYFHPIQVVLDYPMAFACLGLAGWKLDRFDLSVGIKRVIISAAIILAGGFRLLAHWTSGVVFFAHFAPEGQPVWLYSLVYNASYLVPEVLAYILLVQMILRFVYPIERTDLHLQPSNIKSE